MKLTAVIFACSTSIFLTYDHEIPTTIRTTLVLKGEAEKVPLPQTDLVLCLDKGLVSLAHTGIMLLFVLFGNGRLA